MSAKPTNATATAPETARTSTAADFELVKIEGREKQYAIGQPWITVSECHGRAGCFVRDLGFAHAQPTSQFALRVAGFAEIGRRLLNGGLKHGQRAIVRIKRTYPKGETAYFRFSAE